MLHLPSTVAAKARNRTGTESNAATVCATTKIEASDVDAS
jgi:hypothetical protein